MTARVRRTLDALEHLIGGLATAILALFALLWLVAVALSCLAGVGILLIRPTLRALRVVTNQERSRLARWVPDRTTRRRPARVSANGEPGGEIAAGVIRCPEQVPARLRSAARDDVVRRELGWLAAHGTLGLTIGLFGVALPFYVLRDLTYPLYWWLIPGDADDRGPLFWPVHDFTDALLIVPVGLMWTVALMTVAPGMARLQAWPGRRLLLRHAAPEADLSLQVAQLSAARAAALDAHATELRRIERSLHDGTQSRLVAVNVMLGATRRTLARDPAGAEALLERAQDASEQALAELRSVVRGILPPVLDDRGLAGAIAGLASTCAVPCRFDVDVPGRCAVSVEATAYFVVAEALTNISKHSDARRATVILRQRQDRLFLRIHDDGKGGAGADHGTGIAGIRSRIEAHDGHFSLTSPPGGPTTLLVELPCGL
ncbi:sensor histidine kinase [Actinomadura spongiicola]|uniref:histidine kinase n=1 Tax=Actinomadura spongiicola TaxID=2303421 RepID=A0A372GR30_9ACTN|nr:sensor histidine kinase [Actinomadura spongiicola]